MTENANALIGTRYINDDVLFEPIFIVAKKKIVVPKPNDSDDITIKFIKNIKGDFQNIDFLGFVDLGNNIKPYSLPYPIQSSLFYGLPLLAVVHLGVLKVYL